MNPYDFFDSIYCINLDRRTDRWGEAVQEFKKAVIENKVTRISAVDLPDNPSKGNHLSHARALRDAKEKGARNCLIFEDDIEWINDPLLFKRVVPEIPHDYGIIYLGVNTERDCYQISRHLAKLTFAFSTHAYAINSNMFDKMIELNEDPTTIHNDVRICNEIIPNYNCFQTIPFLAGQRNDYSDIQKTQINSNPIFIQRFEEHLKPMWFPVAEPTFVTFITPTLGRPTLSRTINSIINQQDWDWKSVVMFDGKEPNYSTDNDHIIVTRTADHLGAGQVRNEAMKLVTTDWIAFVDDDDWLELDYIDTLKQYCKYDIVIFTYKDVKTGNVQPPIDSESSFRFGNVGISFAVKTDFLIKNNIKFREVPCEDYHFLDDCRNAGASYINTHLIKYWVGGRGEWQE